MDIELPGTGPTIRIIRTAQLEDGYGTRTTSGNVVGGWEIEIPRLKTVAAEPVGVIRGQPLSSESPYGWQVAGPDKNARCAHFGAPADVTYPTSQVEFPVHKWWFGYQLVDDMGNEQAVFARSDFISNDSTH